MAKTDKKDHKSDKAKASSKTQKSPAVTKHPITSTEILAKAAATNKEKALVSVSKKNVKSLDKKKVVTKDEPKIPSNDESSSDDEEKPKAAQLKAASRKAASSSESSDSDSSEEDQPKIKKPSAKPAGKTATGPAPKASSKAKTDPVKIASSSSSEESSDEPKKNGKDAKESPSRAKANSSSSSSDESSEESSEESKKDDKLSKMSPSKTKVPPAKPSLSSSSSEDSSDESEDEEKEKAKPSSKATMEASSDEESEEDSSEKSADEDDDVKMTDGTAAASKPEKRKATDEVVAPPKRVKFSNEDATPADEESKSIFVGRLSWSVDSDRLGQEFASCGEVVSATVQMDRNTGKSRGFGYVHFATADAVEKALAMNGQEIDGRAVNIDRSTQVDKSKSREKRAQTFGDSTSPPSSTLFVGNLSFSVSEDAVWSFFNEYGVKSVRLPTDRETGRPKGFGYVEFEDVEGAKKAFEASNGAEIEGRSIRLDYSQPRDGSGGGGGRGGRGDRGGRGQGRGRGRGGDRGGDRGGRGGRGFGRGARGGNARSGGIAAFEGRKITF